MHIPLNTLEKFLIKAHSFCCQDRAFYPTGCWIPQDVGELSCSRSLAGPHGSLDLHDGSTALLQAPRHLVSVPNFDGDTFMPRRVSRAQESGLHHSEPLRGVRPKALRCQLKQWILGSWNLLRRTENDRQESLENVKILSI